MEGKEKEKLEKYEEFKRGEVLCYGTKRSNGLEVWVGWREFYKGVFFRLQLTIIVVVFLHDIMRVMHKQQDKQEIFFSNSFYLLVHNILLPLTSSSSSSQPHILQLFLQFASINFWYLPLQYPRRAQPGQLLCLSTQAGKQDKLMKVKWTNQSTLLVLGIFICWMLLVCTQILHMINNKLLLKKARLRQTQIII